MPQFVSSRLGTTLYITAASATLLFSVGCSRDPNVRKHRYLESAKRYEKDGKDREAIIQLSNAIKIDNSFADAHYEAAKVYLQMGSLQPAYGELLKTVDLNPANLEARFKLGSMQLAGGAPERAQEQANAILAQDPNNAEARALLSGVDAQKGDRQGARKELNTALSLSPGKPELHVQMALLAGQENPGDPAVQQELQKAISLDGSNASARLLLAGVLEKQGNVQGALAELRNAQNGAPKNLEVRESLAAAYLRAGDKTNAESTLRKAAEDFSDTRAGASLLSEYYVGTGQAERGVAAYADLIKDHPKSIELKAAYARLLLVTQRNDEASKLIASLKNNAQTPEVQMLNAGLLLNTGKNSEALALLRKAVDGAPEDPQLRLALGNLELQQGDLKAAATNFDEVLKRQPTNMEALVGAITVADRNHDSSQVLSLTDRVLAINPNVVDAYAWRGAAEVNQKDFTKAEQDLGIALSKDPSNLHAIMSLAQLKFLQNREAEGVTLLERAVSANPNATIPLQELVHLDVRNNHPEKGAERVNQQIQRSPNNADLYQMLAALDLTTRDFNGALSAAEKALQLVPASEVAVQEKAQAQAGLGNLDGAIAIWQNWMNSHPNDSGALGLEAQLEDRKGDKAKAIELYHKVLTIKPGDPMASNNLAYLIIDTNGNLDEALTLAQDARRAMPGSGSTADTLAWVYYHKGRYASARDLLEDALKTNPNDADAQYHLGMTYSQLNDKAKAQLHLKKAVALGGESQTAKDAGAALAKLV